jgi:cytochrome c553
MKKILLIGCLIPVAIFANNLNSCTGCHGKNFEKSALGSSKIVSNMSKQEIKEALEGYKNKTYGSNKKAIMYSQVNTIKDFDHAAENIYNISHGEKTSPNKKKCLSKLKKIEKCVEQASNKEEMKKCRLNLIKFANKVEEMHFNAGS